MTTEYVFEVWYCENNSINSTRIQVFDFDDFHQLLDELFKIESIIKIERILI